MTTTDRLPGFNLTSDLMGENTLYFVAYTMGTTPVQGTSGAVFHFTIKADENASVGPKVLKFTDVVLSNMMAEPYVEYVTFNNDFKLYTNYTITTATEDATKGSVSEGATVESGTEVTVTATPVTGYDFVAWKDGDTQVSTDAAYTFTPTKSITLTATFKAHVYTATFKSEGKSENKNIAFGEAVTAPTPATKTGYTFSGWDNLPQTMPAQDITVTALYTKNKYKVTFDVDGVKTESELEYNAAITKPQDPTKEGYTFAGWNPAVPANVPASAATYTATWTINQYTVKFVVDNTDVYNQKQDYASTITKPANPTKKGHTFKGWTPEVAAKVPAADVTYTAVFEVNKYKLTFDVDGVKTESEVEYDAAITKPADPTKEGYTFAGWDAEVLAKMPDQALTYTATWTINQYTVKFVVDNTDVYNQKQDYASTITKPADPTKKGHTFKGWTPEVAAKVPAADVTYTAVFEVNKYKLTFDVDGVKTESELEYDAAITKPTDPTKEGYTFAGWDAEVLAKMPDQALTYTATWTINQYTVKFVVDNTDVYNQKQDYASAIAKPADPTKTGYTFKGWNPEVAATVPAEDVTYTAVFEINKYKLTFVVDGEKTESEVEYDAAITKPQNPTKEGYTFTGWNPAEIPAKMPDQALTYTAQFQINKYKVKFVDDDDTVLLAEAEYDYDSDLTTIAPDMTNETNNDDAPFSTWVASFGDWTGKVPAGDVVYKALYGGEFDLVFKVDGQEVKKAVVEYNSAFTAPDSPSKNGYTFQGWKDQFDKAPADYSSKMPAKNVIFEAQWEIIHYTFTYTLNGGAIEGENPNLTDVTIESSFTLKNPVRKGYNFVGWTATGIATPSTQVAIANTQANNTYVANWEAINYNLTYNLNGGALPENITNPATYTIEDAVALNNPVKEGYTFTGWTGTELAEASTSVTIPAGSVDNRSYEATWSINSYKVKFVDGNDVLSEETMVFGSSITAPTTPNKDGLVFIGWNPELPQTVQAGDFTYSTVYVPATFKAYFKIDNADFTTVEVKYGEQIPAQTAPEREGYTFSGWSEIPATMPASDVTITGTYVPNKYTVKFVLGNEVLYEQLQDFGTAITIPNVTEPEGWLFSGWDPEVDATVPAHDVTYTATLTENSFRITYYLENELWIIQDLKFGEEIGLPEVPEKEGYTFAGWKNAQGQSDMPETMPSRDLTYYGDYTINQYTVKFVFAGKVISEKKQNYNTAITAPQNPQNEGYTFVSWGELDATVPAHDVTYEAQYTVNTYKVTYKVEGMEDQVFEVAFKEKVPAIDEPEVEGFTFEGWDDEIPETMPAKDITFTAKFTVNTYVIRYYRYNEESEGGKELLFEDEVEYGAPVVLREYELEDPDRYSYVWDGETVETMPAHDLEYILSIVDGITAVFAEGPADVFTLNGTKVRSKATAKDVQNLPAGMYIVRGKKVLIK
ncbi:MAG: InlB B-repeat-containing protein [Bacteroidaceae bacterium]|nr:InlB B-repeat-containing protein [Bacteroidaceae bacterium]